MSFVEGITQSFYSLAQQKKIIYEFNAFQGEITTQFTFPEDIAFSEDSNQVIICHDRDSPDRTPRAQARKSCRA